MEQCKNKANALAINILFIYLSFDWPKKTSSAVKFWRNVYICRVADEENSQNKIHYGLRKGNKKNRYICND